MTLTEKIEVFGENPVPAPFGTLQIPQKLVWDWTRASALTVRWLVFLDCMAVKMKLKARRSFRTPGNFSPAQYSFTRYKAKIFSRTAVAIWDLTRQV